MKTRVGFFKLISGDSLMSDYVDVPAGHTFKPGGTIAGYTAQSGVILVNPLSVLAGQMVTLWVPLTSEDDLQCFVGHDKIITYFNAPASTAIAYRESIDNYKTFLAEKHDDDDGDFDLAGAEPPSGNLH